jgi:hypothetical protein
MNRAPSDPAVALPSTLAAPGSAIASRSAGIVDQAFGEGDMADSYQTSPQCAMLRPATRR